MGHRLAIGILLVALVAGLLAVPAGATRRPSQHEAKAIRAATEAWLKQNLEPAFFRKTHILRIAVSSKDHQYAKVLVLVKDVGYNAMLLRATSKGWKVLDFGSGGITCGLAPRAVLKDLFGGCVPA